MRHRLKVCLTALAILAAQGGSAATTPRDPSGAWLTEDTRARIRIEKCGPTLENLCGYVVWLKVPLDAYGLPRPDTKNPDIEKAERALLGHQLILGLKPNADGRFEGKIYNSEDGKKYDVTIWLDEPNDLKVKGCLIAFLCSTQTWSRTTDAAPGQLMAATGSPGGPQADPEWASTKQAVTTPRAAQSRRDAPKPKP